MAWQNGLGLTAAPWVLRPHTLIRSFLRPALDFQELRAGCGGSGNLQKGAFDGMGCTGLQSLDVTGNMHLSLDGLAAVCGPSLRKLDASVCGLGHGAGQALAGCTGLQELVLGYNSGLGSLVGLSPSLRKLDASKCGLGHGALVALAGCTGLQELVVRGNRGLEGLEGLGPSLRKLNASECGLGHGSLGALAGCTGLQELDVRDNCGLEGLGGVEQLGSLTALVVSRCGLRDLSPLGPGLERLARLDLRGNPGGAGLLPPALARLPALQEAVVDEGVPPPEGWVVHASSFGPRTLRRAAP
jgi:hypothetical protein